MKSKLLLLILLFSCFQFNAQNLLTNSSFETGGSGNGFVTNGAGYSQLLAASFGTTVPGNFAVTNYPKTLNTTDFNFVGDHTTGAGRMLIIDGNTTAGNPPFWRAGNTGAGVTGLTVGTTYYFSYWIRSVSNLVVDTATQADIDVQLVSGGTGLVRLLGNNLAPLPADGWRQVVFSFTATATTAQIELSNSNTNAVGNDFAVDDFLLTDDLMIAYEVVNADCITANDGEIAIFGFGGTVPYINYSISGPVTQNNATGLFTNIPPGVYTISITDSALPTANTVSFANVVVGPTLTTTPNSPLCLGSSITLNVSGSSTGYAWTASPADATLTTPNSSNPTVSPSVTTVYTVSSTVGACAPMSKSFTVTINPLPIASFPIDFTICPNNTASITLTGTPSSTVTITNDIGNTYIANIGAGGTGNFITPPLEFSRVYTIVSVRNFFTQCQRDYLGTGDVITITVVPNGCATVDTQPAPGTKPLDTFLCTTDECRTLEAEISPIPSTTSYTVSSIPYCPQASFNDPSFIQFPLTSDDSYSPIFSLPFDFCFYGTNFSNVQIGDNGVISFVTSQIYTPNTFGENAYVQDLPFADPGFPNDGNQGDDSPFRNMICGVFQDTDASEEPAAGSGLVKNVNYQLVGQYPCRKLIVNFNLGQFSCGYFGAAQEEQASQIVLYEVSNIIEVYVKNRRPCNNHQGGRGVIGIKGGGANPPFAVAPGRDSGNWDTSLEAWRFTPTGPDVPVTIKWFDGPDEIGTGPTITVCPDETTTYTLNAEYTICGVPQTATSDVTLSVNPDLTGDPIDLIEGINVFDLTENEIRVLGSLPAGNYEISFHTSFADAENQNNPIDPADEAAFISSGQTIYMSITPLGFNCIVVKEFDLIVQTPEPEDVPDLELCESSFGSGTATFDFTPQTVIAYGANYSPSDFTITYHLSQTDADIGFGDISPINNFLGSNGQEIFIRMVDNTNPTIYGTTSFFLIVNPIPTATISGATSICSGQTATVTFTGTPNTRVTYTVDSGANQTVDIGTTGIATVTTPALTADSTYTIISIENLTTTCSQTLTGSVLIDVIDLPTATISGTTTVCEGSPNQLITFTGANGVAPYTFTYLDSNGVSQTTSPSVGNSLSIPVSAATDGVFTYTLTSVSSSTSPVCSQAQTGIATVTVSELPTATITGGDSVCLNSPQPQIIITGSGGTTPYTITYSINSVIQPTIVSSGSTVIINAPTNVEGTFDYELISIEEGSSATCSQPQTASTTVIVNDAPIINTPTAYEVCDENNDGLSCLFDLTTKINQITGGDPNVVVEFFETSTSGAAVSTNYCSIDDSGFQTLYVRAYFAGTPACFLTTTLQLIVHPRPFANPTITDYALCDYTNPGDGEEVFTLNSKTAEIINGQVGLTVGYYLTQQDAEDQINPLPNLYTNTTIGAPQTIWINIRNVTTGCNSVSSFNIVVNPLPVAVTPLAIFECSIGTSTTQAEFDLTVNENVTTAGATGVTVTYYLSLSDAQTPTNAIPSPTTFLGNDGQTIYIRVEYTATGCYSTTTQLLRVTEGPTANVPQPLNYCDPNNDGFGVFDLDSTITAITGGQAGVTVTFHETQDDANIGANAKSSPYSNIVINQQTIYVRVFYTTTGCSNFVELKLIVNPTPEATVPNDLHLCDYTGAVGYEPFDLTLVIPEVLGSINPTTHVVTFYDDPTNAQQGINNITSTSGYINGTINQETIYVRVETIATGCFDIVDFDIIVDPLPLITRPNYPQYSVCDLDQSEIGYEIFDLNSKVADILLGQTGMEVTFYPSISNAEDNINAITNLNYENEDQYVQTLGIRITNTTTKCYVVSSIDIRVEPLPSPIPPLEPYTVCDDDQDGVSCGFDLTTLVADLVQSANYTITFHETQVNANRGENAINTTINYCNIRAYVQTLYVRAVDNLTGCWSTLPIELNVNPSPSAPVNVPNIEVCDTDTNTQNAITNVNLVPQTAIVLAQQPLPATSYIVTYHTNPTDAATGDDEIVNTTSYSATNGQTIWVRLENIATGCYNVGSFQVIIDIPLIVATPTPINECDDDANPNDQFTNFDLTVRNIAPANHSLNYYPSLAQAQSNSDEITNITNYTNDPLYPAVQTLGVKITTPAGCISYTTLDIRVLPIPEPLDPSSATPELVLPAVCENAPNSGQQTLDLTINEAYIRNGETTLVLHYFPTLTDLENNTNELLTPNAALVGDTTLTGDPIDLVQYVYIAVSSPSYTDYTGRDCFEIIKQGYIINPLPVVDIIGTTNVYQICESDPVTNDNIEVFDLTSQIPDLLETNLTTPVSNYSVAFYEDMALSIPITNPSSYTNTSNPQTIYVVITNTSSTSGCSSLVGQFNLQVNPKPIIATQLLDFESCDLDGVNDGQTLYDNNPLGLSDYIDDILGATQSASDFTVSFYFNSQLDAEQGNIGSAIQDLATYQVQTGTYWIRVENNLTKCYVLDDFEVVVEKLAEPNLVATTNIACVNWGETTVNNSVVIDSQVTGDYTFEWYADGVLIAGENSATLTVSEIDKDQVEFSVIAISNSSLLCASDTAPSQTKFTIIRSGIAANLQYTVSNAFSEQQIITVSNDGYGIYNYSLDDGPILDNGGVFEDVSFGSHTVYVWDVRDPNGYSCGVQSIQDVQIIDYPHYFTPNGDGIHDTWNIVGLSNQPTAKIYIFDRYGKLLKQISSKGDGWDGTFNGQPLPSTDYWFSVEYLEQNVSKEFKAHFSLKR